MRPAPVLGFVTCVLAIAFVLGSAPPSPPGTPQAKIVKRWKCGDCDCCELDDGSRHSDCPNDPVCGCCAY